MTLGHMCVVLLMTKQAAANVELQFVSCHQLARLPGECCSSRCMTLRVNT